MHLAIDQGKAIGIGLAARNPIGNEDRKRFAAYFAWAPKLNHVLFALSVRDRDPRARPFTAIVHRPIPYSSRYKMIPHLA